MTRYTADLKLLERVCCGDNSPGGAMDFLAHHWSPYVHEIDDIMDGERPNPRDQLKTFARAAMLFSHPFYLKNLLQLRQLVINITIAYADSVEWEKSTKAWHREWADHHRHIGMEMVVAVATLCGGHEHGFAISQEQRTLCWQDHHTRSGEPI